MRRRPKRSPTPFRVFFKRLFSEPHDDNVITRTKQGSESHKEGEGANGLKPAKSSAKEEMLTLLKFVKSDVTPPAHGSWLIYVGLGIGLQDN